MEATLNVTIVVHFRFILHEILKWNFHFTDIEISIQVGLRQLTLSVNIPNVYKNKMHGLMGNFDGDSTNDFRLPNGTILSNDDTNTEKKLFHNFGGHCK